MKAAGQPDVLTLSTGQREVAFRKARLNFSATGLQNVFGYKNNKTLAETFTHPRYAALAKMLAHHYAEHSCVPLGQFLEKLKAAGDESYKKFLNRYGDGIYCTFSLVPDEHTRRKGLYAFTLGDKLVYIGRSRDPFLKRFNQGYGKIHPKNCYIDGQATNCHLNALIATNCEAVSLFLCPLDDDQEIIRLEGIPISRYKPEWNIALK